MDLFGAAHQAGKARVGIQVDLLRVVLPGRVHDPVADGDERRAAFCLAAVIGDIMFAQGSVVFDVALRRGGCDNAVA
jgi:hypothetical protein